jgi:hypothetical protein
MRVLRAKETWVGHLGTGTLPTECLFVSLELGSLSPFFWGVGQYWDLNSELQVYEAGALLLEPHPWPAFLFFSFFIKNRVSDLYRQILQYLLSLWPLLARCLYDPTMS